MYTGKHNFLIAIADQLLCFKKNIIYLLAYDFTSDIGNYAVRTENIASVFNLQERPCMTVKLTDLQVECRFITAQFLCVWFSNAA